MRSLQCDRKLKIWYFDNPCFKQCNSISRKYRKKILSTGLSFYHLEMTFRRDGQDAIYSHFAKITIHHWDDDHLIGPHLDNGKKDKKQFKRCCFDIDLWHRSVLKIHIYLSQVHYLLPAGFLGFNMSKIKLVGNNSQ